MFYILFNFFLLKRLGGFKKVPHKVWEYKIFSFRTRKHCAIVHVAHELVVLASAAADIPVQSAPSFMTQFSRAGWCDDHWPRPEQSRAWAHPSEAHVSRLGVSNYIHVLYIDIQRRRIYYDTAVRAWSYWEMALGSLLTIWPVGEGFAFLFQVEMPF